MRLQVRSEPKNLYTVIPEKKTQVAGFMGSEHRYDFSYQKETDIALNPDELQDGISTELLKKKLAAEKEQAAPPPKAAPWAQASKAEDLSEMVAQHSQQQAKKQKTKEDKKKKDFKF
jgi:splicing factor 3B subunit 2